MRRQAPALRGAKKPKHFCFGSFSIWCALSAVRAYFERLATHSRFIVSPSRPGLTASPVIVSPAILPLYLVTNLLSPNCRSTVKAMTSPLMVPSAMSTLLVAPSRPGELTFPVSFPSFSVRVSVDSRGVPPPPPPLPPRPCWVHFQVPLASAAKTAADIKHAATKAAAVRRNNFIGLGESASD